ncbi:type II toxin-antitoxin system RelE/ParE family toxin [Candidatus Bipolaricaulota bacterium]|nr:type II toxin-antitoxin system RelE/ParE family toxin [Candidatus Bipolaricaulota bacterium]
MKDLSKLAPETKERIREALEKYVKTPLDYARKMVDPALGSYKFRIGDYRVIFDLEGDELVVLRIGHRREIYRK